MARHDRHARHRRTASDRRRRPVDGFRAPSAARFDRLVARAVDALPSELRDRIDNLDVTTVDVPPVDNGDEVLLGLYQGIPRTEREFGAAMLPDRVTIFRRPIEFRATSSRDLAEIVRDTVLHEVAHHFGIDDDRLDELGWS